MPDVPELAFERPELLDRARTDRRLAYTTFPERFDPVLFRPVSVPILMVTDAGGSFGTGSPFGLGDLLNILAVSPGPYVRFSVTRANRAADPSADLPNFSFQDHDLSRYDQIWLIGVSRDDRPLTDEELTVVAQFMDGGGGVFATGDHEDLGAALSSRVPRVRSMRKWYFPNPGPDGEPVAPPVNGPDRHDTLRAGADGLYEFTDQSDDVPQEITPKLYTASWGVLRREVYPHPLLCGPRGVIRVLPDHMHEGEVIEPGDLTRTLSFGGQTFTEYPALPDGTRPSPEIIAWATVLGGRRSPGVDVGPVNAKRFGVIGAYDGHRAGVGRVAVDSTWHHLFNINLGGDPTSPDPAKQHGFLGAAPGSPHARQFEDIQAYFRNLAVWLSRPTTLSAMARRALWAARWHHALLIEVRPWQLTGGLGGLDLGELLRVGVLARDVLGRLAPRCQSVQWLIDLLREVHPELLTGWPDLDPWWPRPPLPDPPPFTAPLDTFLSAFAGALIYAIGEKFPHPTADAPQAGLDLPWQDFARAAARVAAGRTGEAVAREVEALGAVQKQLAALR